MSASQPPLPTFDGTLDALFVGFILATLLYGCIIVQTSYYVTSKRRNADSRWLKTIVYTLLIVDTAHQTFISAGMYRFLVSDFANPAALPKSGPVDGAAFVSYYQAFTAAACIVLVQMFYAWRIWKFSTLPLGRWRWVLGGVTGLLSLLNFVFYIAVGVVGYLHPLLQGNVHKLTLWVQVSASSGVVCDVFITASMVASLLRSRTCARRSDNVIKHLILWTIQTGVITVLLSITGLVTYVVIPHIFIYGSVSFVLPKSYIISFLAVQVALRMSCFFFSSLRISGWWHKLNSRDALRDNMDEASDVRWVSSLRFRSSIHQSVTATEEGMIGNIRSSSIMLVPIQKENDEIAIHADGQRDGLDVQACA